jgi:hypothetical protein
MARKSKNFNTCFSAVIFGETYSIMAISESPTTAGVACTQFPATWEKPYLAIVEHDGTIEDAKRAAIAVITELIIETEERTQVLRDVVQGIYEGVRGNLAPLLYKEGQLVRAEARTRAAAAESLRQALVTNLASYSQQTRAQVLNFLGVPADIAAVTTERFASIGEILLQQEIEHQIQHEIEKYAL